jgi:hypothetical protein
MSRAHYNVLVGILTIGYCTYSLVGAIRNGYFRGSRTFGHRYIYREKEPRLYWFNFIAMTVFLVLGLLLLGWGLISPRTFH